MERIIKVTVYYDLDKPELKGCEITPKEKVRYMVNKDMIKHFGWNEGFNGVEVEVVDTETDGDLLPCPFCSGEAELREIDYDPNWRPTFYDPDSGGNAPTYVVGCKQCSASTIYRYNEKDAINAWNKRL